MAERLGSAVLVLSTDDSRFTKSVARAEGGARKLGTRFGKVQAKARTLGVRLSALGARVRTLGRSFFNLRNAAILAAGITGIALLTKRVLDNVDSMVKSADVIGIGTETLQKWTFAAGQAGVSSDKFVQGLKTFGKQIGDARAGSGTLTTILGKMNPVLLKMLLNTNSVEEAFKLFITAIGNTENQMDRLALAAAGFGRGAGAAMVNIAKDGGKAFFEWGEQLVAAGGVLPDKLTRPVEGAVDELSFLTELIRVNFVKAMLEATPAISRLAKQFSDAIPDIVEFITNIIEVVAEFAKANPALSKWGLIVGAAVLVMGPLLLAFGALVSGIGLLLPAIVTAGTFIAGLGAPIIAIIAALAAAGVAFFTFGDEIIEALQPAIDFIMDFVRPAIDLLSEFFGIGGGPTAVSLPLKLPDRAEPAKAAAALETVGDAVTVFTDESIMQAARLRKSTFQFTGEAVQEFGKVETALETLGDAVKVFTDESIRQAARLRKSSFQFEGGGVKTFQRGGSFTVPGTGGIDSQMVRFMATPGERVTVTPEGGTREGARFNIDARGADLGIERRIERAMARAVRLASAQAGNDFAAALRASGA